MLRNYFKIAVRSLRKHKLYSFINVFGLALGMACSLLIGLWVKYELSYDRFWPDADRIHFVRINSLFNGETQTSFVTPGPLQEVIAKDIPEVAAVTKLTYSAERLVKVGEKSAQVSGRYASADFFRVFEVPVRAGDPQAALAQPNRIVITRRVAEQFFPNGQALGQPLQLDNDRFFTVGAILENLPTNGTVAFDWLVNFQVQEQDWMKTWGNNSFTTYVRLKPRTTAAQAEATMKSVYERYTDWKNAKSTYPVLQPLTEVHLYGEYQNGRAVGGRIEYVRIFSLVAVFMLLIACINFMNLATARSAMRAKEVGVRKVVGAERLSLVGQFLSESVLTSLLAVGLALGLVWTVLPTFNAVFDKQLALDLTNPALWLGIGGLVLLTGLLAGSYPALFLSGLQPVRILKGTLGFGTGRASSRPAQFRRALVVFQFTLSVFLIVGMLAVGRQMQYLRTKHLGLDRENLLYVPLEGDLNGESKTETYRQEVLRLPSVAAATTTSDVPLNIQGWSGDLNWSGKDPNLQTQTAPLQVGGDFIRTMNIQLLAGRDFRTAGLADSASYIINETAAKLMGMTHPVGQEMTFWMGKGRIVGLMKDFHLKSLHEPIGPLVLMYNPIENSYLFVKTRAGQTPQALADLERVTKALNPNYPFTYHFLDEAYEKLYRAEQQIHTLVNYFGVLAILISCLGLFGLSAFTAEQRTKEIGVRKVLGASVANIVGLLSKDFLRLVLLALVIASPLAWWAVNQWLRSFEYRAELSWWVFGLAGILAVAIALLTVSFQSVKAALMNPVKSLRTE
jgi:putative ABC transport system permease protein